MAVCGVPIEAASSASSGATRKWGRSWPVTMTTTTTPAGPGPWRRSWLVKMIKRTDAPAARASEVLKTGSVPNLPPLLPPTVDVLLGWSDGGGEELGQSLCCVSEQKSGRTSRPARPLLPGLRLRRLQLRLPRAQLPQVDLKLWILNILSFVAVVLWGSAQLVRLGSVLARY